MPRARRRPRRVRAVTLLVLAVGVGWSGAAAAQDLGLLPAPSVAQPAESVDVDAAGGGRVAADREGGGEAGELDTPAPAPTPDAGQGAGAEAEAEAAPAGVAATPAAVSLADSLAGVLPGEIPFDLGGKLLVAPGSDPAPASGSDTVQTVRVEVEAGLPLDVDRFAKFVMDTLNDPRGWGADGSVTFARTDGAADLRVVVASPATVDRMCAPLETDGKWSCGRYGHAALNARRWVTGADAFLAASGGDLTGYRHYLVNHEVGHLIGKPHTTCPAPGAVAPVMLQQSLGVAGCVPNGWPFP